MSKLQYFTYAGFGERSYESTHYNQAVRAGSTIKISGQGGWNRSTDEIPSDRLTEIDGAFDNVEHTLKQAGSTGFEQVYSLRIYLAPYTEGEVVERLVDNLKRRFIRHRPIMTVVGVERLFGKMTVEIEAEAWIGE